MIAGEAGLSYLSPDAGATWEVIEMPYPGSMFSIVASGGDCIMVFGLRGHVQESCDRGVTWTELGTGTEASLSGGTSGDGGITLAGNSGAILRREGQEPLEVIYHTSGVDFSSIIATGSGGFLLVGEDGVHHFPESGHGEGGEDVP